MHCRIAVTVSLWGVIVILFVYSIYIYPRYGCKLNSLILADLFVRRFEESCYRIRHRFTLSGYLPLGKWIQYFGLSHSTALVLRMFTSWMYWVINGARLLTENDRVAYFLHDQRVASGWHFEQSGVRGTYARYRLNELNVGTYFYYVNKEELLYLLTVAKLNN